MCTLQTSHKYNIVYCMFKIEVFNWLLIRKKMLNYIRITYCFLKVSTNYKIIISNRRKMILVGVLGLSLSSTEFPLKIAGIMWLIIFNTGKSWEDKIRTDPSYKGSYVINCLLINNAYRLFKAIFNYTLNTINLFFF